jgi:hypothetical protein
MSAVSSACRLNVVVAQRRWDHRLPAVLARQRGDPITQPVQAQAAAEEEVQRGDVADRALGRGGHAAHLQLGGVSSECP